MYKDWDKLNSDISELGLMDDNEQPLPSNIMFVGGGVGNGLFPGYRPLE